MASSKWILRALCASSDQILAGFCTGIAQIVKGISGGMVHHSSAKGGLRVRVYLAQFG